MESAQLIKHQRMVETLLSFFFCRFFLVTNFCLTDVYILFYFCNRVPAKYLVAATPAQIHDFDNALRVSASVRNAPLLSPRADAMQSSIAGPPPPPPEPTDDNERLTRKVLVVVVVDVVVEVLLLLLFLFVVVRCNESI